MDQTFRDRLRGVAQPRDLSRRQASGGLDGLVERVRQLGERRHRLDDALADRCRGGEHRAVVATVDRTDELAHGVGQLRARTGRRLQGLADVAGAEGAGRQAQTELVEHGLDAVPLQSALQRGKRLAHDSGQGLERPGCAHRAAPNSRAATSNWANVAPGHARAKQPNRSTWSRSRRAPALAQHLGEPVEQHTDVVTLHVARDQNVRVDRTVQQPAHQEVTATTTPRDGEATVVVDEPEHFVDMLAHERRHQHDTRMLTESATPIADSRRQSVWRVADVLEREEHPPAAASPASPAHR